VAWSNDRGGSGTASGTVSWSINGITLSAGQNVIAVTAEDGAGNSATDTLTVTYTQPDIPNKQPMADAGPDQTVTQALLTSGSVLVTLDGSSSDDEDNDPLGYAWTQTEGIPVNLMGSDTESPFFSATTALAGQTFSFQLKVNDGKIESDPDSVSVFVEDLPSAGNDPPTSRIGATPTEGMAPLTVSLSGTGTDTDGTVTDYTWTLGDGSSAKDQNISHTYTSPGIYTVKLTVTDNGGATGTDARQIVVSEPPVENSPPNVSISADPLNGFAPLVVNFLSTATDSDGTISSYFWSFGDDTNAQSPNSPHTYDMPGNYRITLTVTDNDGAQASATTTVQVIERTPDLDSDEDGITDMVEVEYALNPESQDTDGDGITDFIEWGPAAVPLDSDGDGDLDALDTDSDNDGKPDSQEGTGDFDEDGAPDYIDRDDTDGPLGDQDQDSIDNSTEVTHMMNPNLQDSDGDGLDDGTEFGHYSEPLDSDGDGALDALDTDSDNDGKPDSQEGTGDFDEDGAPDYIDMDDADGPEGDQDQDGIMNIQETSVGLNPNISDSDQDGIPDPEEMGDITMPMDTDGDGIIDARDRDSDNDGIPDIEESGHDMDNNEVLDRLDAYTATFLAKDIKMSVKVLKQKGRIADMKYLSEPFFSDQWQTLERFRYGGLKFKVYDIPPGELVKVKVVIDDKFPLRTRYWKYDEVTGYQKIRSWTRGNALYFILIDGKDGDADQTANGVIDDPGFIGVSEEEAGTGLVSDLATGGGGSGCSVVKQSSGFPDGLSIFVPLLLLLLVKRMKKT
jgi:PKD repeat protein